MQAIIKKDEVVSESMVQSHADIIIDFISEAISTELLSADANIFFILPGLLQKV